VAKQEFSGRIHRLFQKGFEFETRIVAELRACGFNVSDVDDNGDQYRLGEPGLLSGSCDGYIYLNDEWMITEMKTHNEKSFVALEKDGVKESKPQHYTQMQIYMGYAGLKRALYIAENKNNSDLHFEIVEYDEAVYHDARNKAFSIRNGGPPEKISDKPTFYKCKWCDFSEVCHDDKIPLVNCRTCINFSLDAENKGICGKTGGDVGELESTGCGDHIYRPDLTPWEVVTGGPDAVIYNNGIANCGRSGFPEVSTDLEVKALFESYEIFECGEWARVPVVGIVKAGMSDAHREAGAN